MKGNGDTLALIGSGNTGTAVLMGLLDNTCGDRSGAFNGQATPIFDSIIACTKTKKSAMALQEKLGNYASRVTVLHGSNTEAMRCADAVILGVKPYVASEVLQAPGAAQALEGKLVLSMLAGVNLPTLRQLSAAGSSVQPSIYFARAIPTLAARQQKSSTVLKQLDITMPPEVLAIPQKLFNHVGQTKFVPERLVDVATVFNTACMTMMSVALDGLLDGCVMAGMKRQDAMDIALQGISGLAALLSSGTHPAALRESASSPRGCTIQTLVSLDKAGTRGVFADAPFKGFQHLQRSK